MRGVIRAGRGHLEAEGARLPQQRPGEETSDNTSALASDGFARTLVTGLHPAGPVTLALACNQAGAEDFRVASPTIAAFGLGRG